MSVRFADITEAGAKLRDQVVLTPMLHSPRLSAMTGAELWIKFENMQVTNSFKDRGAANKLMSLTAAERQRGVIAMSAGNHAQSVAYHAGRLGIAAVIVMPETTPFTKVERTREHGAEVILAGETVAEAQDRVSELIAARDLVLVHPYDDEKVIAGQGTVALEMLDAVADLDDLVVPVGGGGLISGCGIAARHLKPGIRVTGAEAALYPSMYHALRGEEAKCGGATLAEGIAVKRPGRLTREIAARVVDDIVLVGETALESAIHELLSEQKTVAEGAGAAGLAAVMAAPERFAGRKVGVVLSGGSIDPRMLASVIYRALERGGRICTLRFQIDDRPGILGRIASLLGGLGANILEVSHQRMFLDIPAKGAELEIMIETRGRYHTDEIVRTIEAQGFVSRILDAPRRRGE